MLRPPHPATLVTPSRHALVSRQIAQGRALQHLGAWAPVRIPRALVVRDGRGPLWFGAAPGGGRGGGSEVISVLGRQRFESPPGQNRK